MRRSTGNSAVLLFIFWFLCRYTILKWRYTIAKLAGQPLMSTSSGAALVAVGGELSKEGLKSRVLVLFFSDVPPAGSKLV